jgi:hypothetical protein
MTRAKDISKIVTDADLSGTLDVAGTVTAGGLTVDGLSIGGIGGLEIEDPSASGYGAHFSFYDASSEVVIGGKTAGSTNKSLSIGRDTGDISFYEDTGTTPKLFWDASEERLGVGTSSPASSLHIQSSIPILRLTDSDTTASHELSGQSGARNLNIKVDTGGTTGSPVFNISMQDSTKVSVLNNGNVGIGESDPDSTLTVKGASHTNFQVKSNSESTKAFIQTVQDSDIRIGSSTNHPVSLYQNGTERMRITSAGNVGIGDSNPQRKISVNGIAKFRNSITLGGSNSSTDYNAYFVNEAFANNADTNSVTLGTHSTRPLIFATNTTERMRIGSNGGTVLTANASGAYAFKVINDGNASNRFGIAIQTGEDSPTTTNYLMGFQDGNGNSVGSITFNNAGQTSFNQISDYRLKENVTEDWNATTRLKELKPCRFNFKRFPNTTLDGFIAHEAQEVVPEAVIGEKDAVDDDGNPIYQGIDQSKLVPLLVKTIQELEARIVALETA